MQWKRRLEWSCRRRECERKESKSPGESFGQSAMVDVSDTADLRWQKQLHPVPSKLALPLRLLHLLTNLVNAGEQPVTPFIGPKPASVFRLAQAKDVTGHLRAHCGESERDAEMVQYGLVLCF